MTSLIYLHGFLSSPESHKAVQVRDWLNANRPDIDYCCPFLTPRFGEARRLLDTLVSESLPGRVILMGSSLGGYWATYLAEKYDLRAVLINPVVRPSVVDQDYIGIELKNFHTNDRYVIDTEDVRELQAADTPLISRPDNYWLLVQTGDETLDYRLAKEKYAACKQLVEAGGDHSFAGFHRHIPEAIRFLLQE